MDQGKSDFSGCRRPPGVEGGHHRVAALGLLPAPAVRRGPGVLLLPDEAAPPVQLPWHPIVRRRPGLQRPAEGCPRLHHGGSAWRSGESRRGDKNATFDSLHWVFWSFSGCWALLTRKKGACCCSSTHRRRHNGCVQPMVAMATVK